MFTTSIRNSANGEGGRKLTLSINGAIVSNEYWNDETGLDRVTETLNEFDAKEGDTVTVAINSGGGDYFAGVAIYNTLKSLPCKVITKNMGIAASAASVIFMAGSERVVCKGTSTMVHDPLTGAYGNSKDLRELADMLDEICESAKGVYLSAGINNEKLLELMAAETMMTPEQAVEYGFATKVDDMQVTNCAMSEREKQLVSNNLFGKHKPEEETPSIGEPVIENKAPAQPVVNVATSDYIVNACIQNNALDLIQNFHGKGFTEEQIQNNIQHVNDVKNVCAASGINFDDVKDNVFNTVELLRSIVSAKIADENGEELQSETESTFSIQPVKNVL